MRQVRTHPSEYAARPEHRYPTDCGLGVRPAVDELVDMCHVEPGRAEMLLAHSRELAAEVSSWGETCLQAASHLGHRRLAVKLLEMGISSDLFVECSLGDPRRAVAAVRAGEHELCGVHCLPILHFAVMSREVEAVERLLAAGASVNSPRATLPPLHSAVACHDLTMVEQLLQAGADPWAVDLFEDTAIDWAVFLEGPGSPMVRLLTQHASRP